MPRGVDLAPSYTPRERGAAPRGAGGTAFTDRYGTAGLDGATIRITDADGNVIEARTSESGNFYGRQPLVFPITAEIEVDGVVTRMPDPVESSGCNSCHSCDGEANGKLYGE